MPCRAQAHVYASVRCARFPADPQQMWSQGMPCNIYIKVTNYMTPESTLPKRASFFHPNAYDVRPGIDSIQTAQRLMQLLCFFIHAIHGNLEAVDDCTNWTVILTDRSCLKELLAVSQTNIPVDAYVAKTS